MGPLRVVSCAVLGATCCLLACEQSADPNPGPSDPVTPGRSTDAGPLADNGTPGGNLLGQRYERPLGVGEHPLVFAWPSEVSGEVEILELPTGTLRLDSGAAEVGTRASAEVIVAGRYTEAGRDPGPAGVLRLAYDATDGERVEFTLAIELVVHPCDELAADALDPSRYAAGVYIEKSKGDGLPNFLNPAEAVPACEEARDEYPLVTRFLVQLARGYAERREYDAAFVLVQQAADAGEPLGIEALGRHYLYGRGVRPDPAEGFRLLSQTAEMGYARSQHEVGIMLQEGFGVIPNDAAAIGLLTAAAEYGYDWSQLRLGASYRDGRGTPVDFERARFWFEKSAAQKNGSALLQLGVLYRRGRGVSIDGPLAEMYLLQAAAYDLEWAYYNLGLLYRDGAPGLPADRDKAIEYLTRAVEAGVQDAQPLLDALL